MPNPPLTLKWNPALYKKLNNFVRARIRLGRARMKRVPDARTMPDLTEMAIGTAKKMLAAVLFFDFEQFTTKTSALSPQQTLFILNVSTTTVMRIVREWKGSVEKHTGDGIMAIIGTETKDPAIIARDAIEVAQTIKYLMQSDVFPQLAAHGLPVLNFRIGIEMDELLISRIGIHKMNFLTAVGSGANRASKLEGLARPNGITIGENLARNLHPFLHSYLELGDDPNWNWLYEDGRTKYSYYHYNFDWFEPKEWIREWIKIKRYSKTMV